MVLTETLDKQKAQRMKLLILLLSISTVNAATVPSTNSAASPLRESVIRTNDLIAEAVNEEHCHSIVEKQNISDERAEADLYDQCEDQEY